MGRELNLYGGTHCKPSTLTDQQLHHHPPPRFSTVTSKCERAVQPQSWLTPNTMPKRPLSSIREEHSESFHTEALISINCSISHPTNSSTSSMLAPAVDSTEASSAARWV